ncbi:MAG: metallopeptidase family protein [Rhizobiales bacterium]|nr:metallopeptidase family protein [Hyphomicrobiales bacterium]
MPSPPDPYRAMKAPGLGEIETIAREEFERLPADFRALCEDLVIRVEDFATDEVLDRMRIDDPFELMGLFEGVGLPFRSQTDVVQMPNMVWLYRRPILDYWAEHEESVGAVVSHVLIHEIGHHFGFSDDDMEAIEAQVAETA